MKISEEAIKAVNTRDNRLRLALELGVSENTARVYINENREDGELTKVSAIKAISEITGLDQSDILIEEPAKTIE